MAGQIAAQHHPAACIIHAECHVSHTCYISRQHNNIFKGFRDWFCKFPLSMDLILIISWRQFITIKKFCVAVSERLFAFCHWAWTISAKLWLYTLLHEVYIYTFYFNPAQIFYKILLQNLWSYVKKDFLLYLIYNLFIRLLDFIIL